VKAEPKRARTRQPQRHKPRLQRFSTPGSSAELLVGLPGLSRLGHVLVFAGDSLYALPVYGIGDGYGPPPRPLRLLPKMVGIVLHVTWLTGGQANMVYFVASIEPAHAVPP